MMRTFVIVCTALAIAGQKLARDIPGVGDAQALSDKLEALKEKLDVQMADGAKLAKKLGVHWPDFTQRLLKKYKDEFEDEEMEHDDRDDDEILEEFAKLDKDGNGYLSKTEAAKAFNPAFNANNDDEDEDAADDEEEEVEAHEGTPDFVLEVKQGKEAANIYFDIADQSPKDGQLRLDEYKFMHREAHNHTKAKELHHTHRAENIALLAAQSWKTFDDNSDGELDDEELSKAVEVHGYVKLKSEL